MGKQIRHTRRSKRGKRFFAGERVGFSVGTKVAQKGRSPFLGFKDKIGTVVEAGTDPYLYYNVKYPDKRGRFEFHAGELKRVKKGRFKRGEIVHPVDNKDVHIKVTKEDGEGIVIRGDDYGEWREGDRVLFTKSDVVKRKK